MSLREAWALRNAAAETVVRAEEQMRSLLRRATADELVELLDAFSPPRSPGPDWTRSFDPLVERLWAWCDPAVLAAVKGALDARGAGWAPVANALTVERGDAVRARLRHTSAPSRLPPFTLA